MIVAHQPWFWESILWDSTISNIPILWLAISGLFHYCSR